MTIKEPRQRLAAVIVMASIIIPLLLKNLAQAGLHQRQETSQRQINQIAELAAANGHLKRLLADDLPANPAIRNP